MSWRVKVHSVILASAFFVSSGARGQSRTEELGPFPTALSLERFQQIVALSPGSNPQNVRLRQEAQWRWASAKSTVPILLRQAIWPVYVQLEPGSRYWGEITRTGKDSFDLTNRQSKETVTLAYSEVRGIGIAKAYPRTRPQGTAEKTLRRTGDIIGIIVLVPVRILEMFLVPQC
jgi:hypothetical protein